MVRYCSQINVALLQLNIISIVIISANYGRKLIIYKPLFITIVIDTYHNLNHHQIRMLLLLIIRRLNDCEVWWGGGCCWVSYKCWPWTCSGTRMQSLIIGSYCQIIMSWRIIQNSVLFLMSLHPSEIRLLVFRHKIQLHVSFNFVGNELGNNSLWLSSNTWQQYFY